MSITSLPRFLSSQSQVFL
ncbi:hypothetical protein MTR67_025101 [Solanum verrucosum]|uniref:Uncharacterized protein n=1 Tax=Solanum verrucosum TaxID=315347 RepID=A0AAF0TTA0_SOLVR|nr:hypothetical protein MTR67_025101 [Solanum verrucosum]